MIVGIAGAGAIGCYLGTRLAAAGVTVHMLARPRVVEVAKQLEAADLAGVVRRPRAPIVVAEDPEVIADATGVLVTCKSAATESIGRALRDHLRPSTPVLTLQNGLFNADRLRRTVRGPVEQGIVSYNVFWDGPFRTQQATAGKLMVGAQRAAAPLADALARAGELVERSSAIERVMAGKLLMNLNNGVCAATGLPIAASLRSRDARLCLGACIREGEGVLVASGRRPISPLALPLRSVPALMSLPDSVVLRVAKRLVGADERAKSSTLQDLERGRTTEIDELNGAIVRLGRQIGRPTPANLAVLEVVREHEAAVIEGETPRFLTPGALRRRLGI